MVSIKVNMQIVNKLCQFMFMLNTSLRDLSHSKRLRAEALIINKVRKAYVYFQIQAPIVVKFSLKR